ncbi:MAG TPA: TonB-dependent receptor [Gallionellaceae bacterium]|nr:TonB-dependent receptor [Gallionellaceae bacterium]
MFKHAIICAALIVPPYARAADAGQPTPAPGAAHPAPPAAGQNRISGVVRDATGKPVGGAQLSLQTADGKTVAKTASAADGSFAFAPVPAGRYSVVGGKAGFRTATSPVSVTSGAAQAVVTLVSTQTQEITIVATRLEKARNSLSPKTGGSAYQFSKSDIAKLPQGNNTPLNQVLLQAPGVSNDSYGQVHVRGDHGDIQYRINGIMLPEAISGFGQSLDTRFAQHIDLLTGALPAEYGFRTAGVVDIETKTRFQGGGNVDLYGGSYGTFNPSVEYGNTKGNVSYFVNGSYLTNDIGIQNPAPTATPLHDRTQQQKGFGYVSYLLNPSTKVSFLAGTYDGTFQIPNIPGQTPDPNNLGILAQMGLTGYDSATLNDNQREVNRFAIAAVQSSLSDSFDYQAALFTRYSSAHYMPDVTGDLAFNGVASDVFRSSASSGLQTDGTYYLNTLHTLRMGLFASTENVVNDNASTVFPVNATGQVSGPAYTIVDNSTHNGNTLLGAYLQDEWKATDRLTVNYGGRYDHVNTFFVNEQQFSPRLGVVFKQSSATAWHAGYARYFTPPPTELVPSTAVAAFQNTTNAPLVTTNDPVKSERSNYFDAGVTQRLTAATSLGLDTFYKRSTNVIDEGRFGQALIMTPYNYAEGKIYGAELTLNYRKGDFSGYANAARIISKAKGIISSQYLFDPATLAYAANNWVNVDHEQAVSATLGGSYLWSGTRWNANVVYQSGLRNGFANIGTLPSYTVLNLGATRTFGLPDVGPVEGRLAILNALDRVYKIRDGSGIGVFAPQYGARRGLYAGVTKSF